eukprot:Opistho-1_new@52364
MSQLADEAAPGGGLEDEEELPDASVRVKQLELMEKLTLEMQDEKSGLKISDQKQFLGAVTPSVFTGADMIDWLMRRLQFFDKNEAIHFAQKLYEAGYLFPIDYSSVKANDSFYRFQTPFFWPTRQWTGSDFDYAVYLQKRSMRDRRRHALQEYELNALSKLRGTLSAKWDFVMMQAEEQIKYAKARPRMEKRIYDSQERAFWHKHRPPPNTVDSREVDPRKAFKQHYDTIHQSGKDVLKLGGNTHVVMQLEREVEALKASLIRPRVKVSVAVESLLNRGEIYCPFDAFLTTPEPSNPWISDEPTAWELSDKNKELPSVHTARRWGIGLYELLTEPAGLRMFREFLRKEYSEENLKFWLACEEIKKVPPAKLKDEIMKIYNDYVAPSAQNEVNLNSTTRELTSKHVNSDMGYDTFDEAQKMIFRLMNKDSYPRFLRSDEYTALVKTPAK